MNSNKEAQIEAHTLLYKIEEAIKSLELRLSLNAQSILPTQFSKEERSSIRQKAVISHNQRANEVIEECQQTINKLNLILSRVGPLPQALILESFAEHHYLSLPELERKLALGN